MTRCRDILSEPTMSGLRVVCADFRKIIQKNKNQLEENEEENGISPMY